MAQATMFGVHPREYVSAGTWVCSSAEYFATPGHDPHPTNGRHGSVPMGEGRRVVYLWDGGAFVRPGHLHPLDGDVPAPSPIHNESHIERLLWQHKVPPGARAKVECTITSIDPETYRKVRLPRFA